VKSDNTLMPLLFMRTLRLRVRSEAYAWLNAAADEVNTVFNDCNETRYKAAARADWRRKGLTGFDLCHLTAGAAEYFDRIGADTIQSACNHYAQQRAVAKRVTLRWRMSRGAIGSRCRTALCANKLPYSLIPPNDAYRVREAGIESARTTA